MLTNIRKRKQSCSVGFATTLLLSATIAPLFTAAISILCTTRPVQATDSAGKKTKNPGQKLSRSQEAELRGYYARCKELSDKKEWRVLVNTASEGLRKFPDTYEFYGRRATGYLYLHMKEAAIADYSKCLELAPNVDVYMVRGGLYKALGDVRKGIEDFKAAQKLQPRADNLALMGDAYLEIQDVDSCIAACKKALTMLNTIEKDMRTHTEARANEIIGIAYLAKKEPWQAFKPLDRAVKITQSWGPKAPASIDPNNLNNDAFKSKCILNRGEAYEKLGDLKNAIADYEAAVKFYPKNFDYRRSLLRAYRKANEDQKALALINQLLREDDSPDLYYKRAEILKKMGQIEKAKIDTARARKIEYGIMGAPVER